MSVICAVSALARVRYGGEMWTLWGDSVKWQDFREVLASVSKVATDNIDRLVAEFSPDDLLMAYRAFDLEACQAALLDDRESLKLKKSARRLCECLSVHYDEDAWREGTAAASLAWTPGTDNRVAWRSVLDAGGLPPALLDVVRFYIATWDGTGAVERGLGHDAAIQKQHVGSRTRSCLDADLYSALLELKLDGPQHEKVMFTQGEDGILLLTHFSRDCANEWLSKRGRRFACYSPRKDLNQKKNLGNAHTDKGVQLRARAAHKELVDMARDDEQLTSASVPGRDTILGVSRVKLMAAVTQQTMPAPIKQSKICKNDERNRSCKEAI